MIKLGSVFSGIGAIEQALMQIGIKHEIEFACDNGERILKIDKTAIDGMVEGLSAEEKERIIRNLYLDSCGENLMERTYRANYEVAGDNFYQDVRFLDGRTYTGNIDLFVGGSPCQSFSIMGKRKGLDEARGTLFYEYARLVEEVQPKVFIYENVTGMLNHDSGRTWKVISRIFDELGYAWTYWVLNARDFGLAQNRRRIFVIGFQKKHQEFFEKLTQPKEKKLTSTVEDYLETNVPNKYYLPEKGFIRVTDPAQTKHVALNGKVARCQVANQQFNWFGDMRFEANIPDRIEVDNRIYKGYYNGQRGVARCLTPRECLRLMGFSDEFKIVVPDPHMYRQVGNSIAVNVIKNVVQQIIGTGIFEKEKE